MADVLEQSVRRLRVERNSARKDTMDVVGLAGALAKDLSQTRERLKATRAELLERCETMARMATGGPCWIAVFLDDHPGAVSAIHFKGDAELIYGLAIGWSNDEKPQEG